MPPLQLCMDPSEPFQKSNDVSCSALSGASSTGSRTATGLFLGVLSYSVCSSRALELAATIYSSGDHLKKLPHSPFRRWSSRIRTRSAPIATAGDNLSMLSAAPSRAKPTPANSEIRVEPERATPGLRPSSVPAAAPSQACRSRRRFARAELLRSWCGCSVSGTNRTPRLPAPSAISRRQSRDGPATTPMCQGPWQTAGVLCRPRGRTDSARPIDRRAARQMRQQSAMA
jgi:hypothetical protein